jgi:hypothetical protein
VIARNAFHDSDRWKHREESGRSRNLGTIAGRALIVSILPKWRTGDSVRAPRPWGVLEALHNPWPLTRALLDRSDERRARRLRARFGPLGRLLSWQPEPTGGWRSRLSSPGLVYTIERVGATRVAAIERTLLARERILKLRSEIQTSRILAASHEYSK